jgi:hypothetical protein
MWSCGAPTTTPGRRARHVEQVVTLITLRNISKNVNSIPLDRNALITGTDLHEQYVHYVLTDAGVVEARHESSIIVRMVCSILRVDRWELNISTESKELDPAVRAVIWSAMYVASPTLSMTRLTPAEGWHQSDAYCEQGVAVDGHGETTATLVFFNKQT